jgi:hypothetical protein
LASGRLYNNSPVFKRGAGEIKSIRPLFAKGSPCPL